MTSDDDVVDDDDDDDDCYQFDMLEDLPGGLASLRAAVDRFHERGVRVLLSYNPWDQGTRWTRLRIQQTMYRTFIEMWESPTTRSWWT